MRESVSDPRRVAVVLAALFLASHLASLAPSLEDIDSINFALGLRDFDPARHQPHPPGSPVYIALGRGLLAVVTVVRPELDRVGAEALALGLWSAVAGAVAIAAAAGLFVLIAPHARPAAAWGAGLLAVSPLFWLSGLRPMSDLPGLAAALVTQVLILHSRAHRRRLVYAGLACGLAAGVRLQTTWLTVPLLVAALFVHRGAGLGWVLTRPVAAAAVGCLAWAVPLVADSGGVDGYLRALGSQAGEDFAWVNMLWLDPTPRRLAFALYETLVLPWGSVPLAALVLVATTIGCAIACNRERTAVLQLMLAFGPYTALHLLFQETLTVRYALPTLVPVAWLAARACVSAGRLAPVAATALVGAALAVSVPLGLDFGRDAHPVFRALDDAQDRLSRLSRAGATAEERPPAAVYAHYSLWRALQAQPLRSAVEPRRQYEWLGPADYWKQGGTDPIWFLADPRRTDLALIDPRARLDVTRYRWAVADRAELGGSRPLGADWYRIAPPGWFAGEGWSLTPETGGLAQATATGPDAQPIEAWVRARAEPLHLMVGGRHLGEPGDPSARFELSLDGVVLDRWTLSVQQRNFLRFLAVPVGLPRGPRTYAPLTILSRPEGDLGRRAAVAVRQFDIQPLSRLLWAFGEGWHEAEYDISSGRQWRWSSERSILQTQGPAGDLRLTVRGESPLRYLDAPPTVRVVAGGRVIAQFRPHADFEWAVIVPAADRERSAGMIAIETEPVYLPGPAEGTSDIRHLGLRVYQIDVDLAAE